MKPHVKLYFDYFGYDTSSWIPCEICGKTATDINHIKARGMGGTKKKDTIENLMALCREHHLQYGDKVEYYDFLNHIHKSKL